MTPRQPLQLEPDTQKPGLQINEWPAEPERLALTKTAAEPDGPARGIATAGHGRQDRTGLLLAETGLTGLAELRWLHELAGVASHIAALDLDLVRAGQNGVDLANRRSREAASEHLSVAVLELLGQEPVDPLAAPARIDLVHTQRAIADDGQGRPAALRKDDRQMAVEHCLYGLDPSGLADLASVASLLQGADSLVPSCFGLALDMTAIRLAIGLSTHPDERFVIAARIGSVGFPGLAVAASGAT